MTIEKYKLVTPELLGNNGSFRYPIGIMENGNLAKWIELEGKIYISADSEITHDYINRTNVEKIYSVRYEDLILVTINGGLYLYYRPFYNVLINVIDQFRKTGEKNFEFEIESRPEIKQQSLEHSRNYLNSYYLFRNEIPTSCTMLKIDTETQEKTLYDPDIKYSPNIKIGGYRHVRDNIWFYSINYITD